MTVLQSLILIAVSAIGIAEIKKAVEADYNSKVKGRVKTAQIYISGGRLRDENNRILLY